MEDVGGGRVVDDDGFSYRPAELAEILDIVAFMVVARFAKEAMLDYLVNI